MLMMPESRAFNDSNAATHPGLRPPLRGRGAFKIPSTGGMPERRGGSLDLSRNGIQIVKCFKDKIASGLLLSTLLFLCGAGNTYADYPDVVSPLVSYVYYDSLEETPAQPNIVSPLVSYLFYDWPGDSNLTFQSSALVSYLFHSAPFITQQPVSQVAYVGTNVTFDVSASGSTPLFYQWYSGELSLGGETASGIYFPNVQTADAGSYSVAVENAYGSVTSSVAHLYVYTEPDTPPPELPTNTVTTDVPPPELTERPRIPSSDQLVIMSHDGLVSRNRMTVVLTHGFNSSSDGWPTEMAAALTGKVYNVNILAWDWRDNADTSDPSHSASRTPGEGETLAGELLYLLGAGYNAGLHFIGHSLGTMVNCRAADYLHGDAKNSPSAELQFNPSKTHMTLLDEAEAVAALNGLGLFSDLVLASADKWSGFDPQERINSAADFFASFGSWTDVVPKQAKWVDNYTSEVGMFHDDALNVSLWRGLQGFVERHGYAVDWYIDSIASPLSSPADPELQVTYAGKVGEGLAYPSAEAHSGLGWLGGSLSALGKIAVSGHEWVIRHTGNLVANYVDAYSTHVGTPVYMGGATPFYEPSYEMDAGWGLKFQLQAGSSSDAPQALEGIGLMALDEAPLENSVYTWIPITIPREAAGLTFQFRFDNAEPDEYLNMGISNVNHFSMESKYVEDGTWETSNMIWIHEYAGKEVELFFSLNGDSEPAGSLSIRGIQFVIPPRPELLVEMQSNAPVVSWPLSAIGWELYSIDSLSETNWMPTTNEPAVRGFYREVQDQEPSANRFYKLQK